MRVSVGRVALFIVAAGCIADGLAAAGEPDHTARLLYTRGDGASACPDEGDLRDTVSARLGYDPFRVEAPRTVAATIVRKGRGLHASVELRDSAGNVTGSRDLDSNTTDCTELASAVTLAISIAIDPLTLSRPAPPPTPTPPPTPPPAPKAEPPVPPPVVTPPPTAVVAPSTNVEKPAAPKAPSNPLGLVASVGAHVAFGASPAAAAFGFTAQLALRRGRFSIGLEGRVDLPSVGDSQVARVGDPSVGRVETQLLGASLVPCFNHWWLQACGLVFGGIIRGRALDVDTIANGGPYIAAGARLGLEIPVWRALAARVHADALAPIYRKTFAVNRVDEMPPPIVAWTPPPVGGVVGIDVVGRF